MNKKNDEIVPAIIRAWRNKFKDDPSKLSRGKLKEAKPGHGTAKYIAALSELKLLLCSKQNESKSDPIQALTSAAQIIQSAKVIIQQNSNEITKLIKENFELKQTIKQLNQQIDELNKLKDVASGGRGARASAQSSPRKSCSK